MWRAWLAGRDGPGRPAPPLGELLDPLTLAGVVALGLNDLVLKGRAPGWLTGKLSDFAGLLFFPLLLTATWDTLLWMRGRGDFSLRLPKLAAAIALSGIGFIGWKLLGILGAVRDPTDLLALVMLGPAWLIGRAEVARVPLGRVEVIARGTGDVRAALEDVARLRQLPGERALIEELAGFLAAWRATGAPADAEAAATVLAKLRRDRKET
jgi:hypothetical protein